MYKLLFAWTILTPLNLFSQTATLQAISSHERGDTQSARPDQSSILPLRSVKYNFRVKEHIAPAALMFFAGAADGLNQVLSFKYASFKKEFPKTHDSFWSPKVSYRNKYKNNDPAQGAKFFGSTTFLVWTTDAYHSTRFAEHLFMVGAVTVKLTQQRKKWYYYLAEAAGYWVMNRAGFALVYDRF